MRALPLALMILLAPGIALAHAGHDHGGFWSGMLHPVGGADHVLAMVALGLLAAQTGGALWRLPVVFVAAMVGGGVMGAYGLPFPAVEPMILASGVLLGVLVALAMRLPMAALVPMVALFGAAHGWAHGAEGPATGLAAYAAGFALATAALHGAGLVLGRLGALPLRLMGGVAALAGVGLAVLG